MIRVVRMPVLVFAAIALYFVGYVLTQALLSVIEKVIKRAEERKRRKPRVIILMPGEVEKPPRRLTEKTKDALCIVGGAVPIALVLLFIFAFPGWALYVLLALMGLGFVTWFIVQVLLLWG